MASASAMVAALAWRMHKHSVSGTLEQAGVRSSSADASASIVLNGRGGVAKGTTEGYVGKRHYRAGKDDAEGVVEPADSKFICISRNGSLSRLKGWGATPVVAAAGAVILLLMVASAYSGQCLTYCAGVLCVWERY